MTSHSHKRLPLLAALLLLGLGGSATAQPTAGPPGVAGRVTGERSPLGSAGVYAFQLAESKLHKVLTDPQGNFLFQDLPAGLYKVIAHKAGFAPVVILLTRTTAQAYQFLELQLSQTAAQRNGAAPAKGQDDDFWALRASIPPDVLRDIEQTAEGELPRFGDDRRPQLALSTLSQFHTDIQAMKGVDNLATAGSGQLAGGRVGIEGKVGEMQVGLRGRFWQFEPLPTFGASGVPAATTGGQTSAVSLDLENGPRSRLNVTSLSNRLMTRGSDGPVPVDFEHYRVSYSQAVGENSRSDLSAQYTSENNFNRQGSFDPVEIPGASRTWRVEGSYTTELGSSSTIQGGVRYRALQYGLSETAGPSQPQGQSPQNAPILALPGQDSLEVFGRGGIRLQPAVLVEYGLYSTMADGSLAVRPEGGVVLRLGDSWQLQGSGSRRAYERTTVNAPQFLPTLYQEADLCEEGGKACYELRLARKQGDDDTFSLSAHDRTFGKTLRLYFSDDFFDRLESLYLVPGDRLPEVKLSVGRRLTPGITTKVEASLAHGGGGVFYSPLGAAYANRVQYFVTSIDTRFQATSTGIFLAFHRLSQELDPLGPGGAGAAASQVDLQRLQLMLSQDLNVLMNVAGDWTVQLNMELSRGISPLASNGADELRKRFLGGIAVKF